MKARMVVRFEKEHNRLEGMMGGRAGAIGRMTDATGGPLQVTQR